MRFLGLEIVTSDPSVDRRSDPVNPFDDRYWTPVNQSTSGVNVTPDAALRVGAVYAAVKVIAETVSSLPLILYRRLDNGGKTRAREHPLYRLLHALPNPRTTRMEWLETLMWHVLLRGNAYSAITHNFQGQVTTIEILHPDRVTIEVQPNGELVYLYQPVRGPRIRFAPGKILHVRGHCDDGIYGKGPIQVARETLGTAIQQEQFSGTQLSNGVRLSGVLEHPNRLDEVTSQRIADSFRRAYAGPSNAGKVAVLEEGMKFTAVSMTNQDAQFIESRKMSRSDIAGVFRVPPHLIGDLERATFSNIEHQNIAFVVHCIRPWLVRLEQAFSRDLLSDDEHEEYFIEFLVDGLLRGDVKTRNEAYNIRLMNGTLRFNEVREMENENPLEWGDATMIPLNMKPVTSAADLFNNVAVQGDGRGGVSGDTRTVAHRCDVLLDEGWYNATLHRISAGAVPLFESLFTRILSKESLTIRKCPSDRERFEERVRTFYDTHGEFVHETLTPAVNSYVESLQAMATMFARKITPLPQNFMAEYVADYCGRRFSEVWAAEPEAAKIEAEVAARHRPPQEAHTLMERVKVLILGGEHEPPNG